MAFENLPEGRGAGLTPPADEPLVADPTAPVTSPRAERPGDIIGGYVLGKVLGEGGMARVFLARHLKLDRLVALKILRAEHRRSNTLVQRFFDEARIVNQINHPHIVQIFDFIEEPSIGRYCCVMEHLEGRTLADVIREGPLPVAKVRAIGRQVAEALSAAHAAGVVHRDLKPANILLLDGPTLSVKLLDFGVAKLSSISDLPPRQTAQGLVLGTPAYMAPEQALGTPTDPRTDIYGLGVVLYEMLAGHPPFLQEGFAALAGAIVHMRPPALPLRDCEGTAIPKELLGLVTSCLAKAPDDRPNSMRAVVASLLGTAQVPHRPKRPSLHRVWALAAGVAVLAAAIGVARSDRSRRDRVLPPGASVFALPPLDPIPEAPPQAVSVMPAAVAAATVSEPPAEGASSVVAGPRATGSKTRVNRGRGAARQLDGDDAAGARGSPPGRDVLLDPFSG